MKKDRRKKVGQMTDIFSKYKNVGSYKTRKISDCKRQLTYMEVKIK